ncbi:MAG: hypothetical protein QM778_27720 [Myxococcales bacterium]
MNKLVKLWFLAAALCAACGGDEAPSCYGNPDPSCYSEGIMCEDDSQCRSGYCALPHLPYEADQDAKLCRERPACELDGCERCALLGELGRTDGPMDQPVCVDACFGDQVSCSVCGCPQLAICDAATDRCMARPDWLAQGSGCTKDTDCESGYCRPNNAPDAPAPRVCATPNETSCNWTNSPCFGGSCWDSVAYTGPVCRASCESQADCTSSTGASFACVATEDGKGFECRLSCSSNNCGGITGGPGRCDTGTLKEGGSTMLCPF